jgi:TetR/AcrR family transcriptional repressor of nem operon
MWRRGISEFSVDDILQGADALRGSFYHFFPTKADLILECLERIWSSQSEGLRAVYELASTPEEGLEQHFAFLAKVQIDAQEAFGFVPGTFNMSMPTSLLREDTRISDKLRQLMDENRRYLERAIQRVKRKRQLTLSASAAARLLSYAWNGMVLAARMENSLTPLRDMKLVLKRVLEDPAAVG